MGRALAPMGIDPELERLRRFAPRATAGFERIGRSLGGRVALDRVRLAAAFLAWRRAAPAYPPQDSFGVLLRELLRHAPLVLTLSDTAPEGPARFWPEGMAAVMLCLEFRRAAGMAPPTPGAAFHDLRTWWSFRENVAEDPECALPFLDLFAGDHPAWERHGPAEGPGLWPVPNAPLLPPGTAPVVFDLAALTEADAIRLRALADVMAMHGAATSEGEIATQFLHRPVGAAMTHVAARTGVICPSHFAADVERRAAELMDAGLPLRAGAADAVAALVRAGRPVLIVAPAATGPATLAALRGRFPGATVAAGDPVALADEHATVVATAPDVVARAAQAGRATLGLAGPVVTRQHLLAAGAQQALPADTALHYLGQPSEPFGETLG